MIVMKFGGTSVGSAARMKHVAQLVKNAPEPVILVLSAMAGTTNQLVEIAGYLQHGNATSAVEKILELEQKYDAVLDDLLTSSKEKEEGRLILKDHFTALLSFTEDVFTSHEERAILAQGELLSTALFHLFMQEINQPSALVSALDFMRIDADGEPELQHLTDKLKPILELNAGKTTITQGFICRNNFGEIDNLKRGGSDYTASLIGAAIGVKEIQIWTDIDGMHNNDPRVVEKTRPIDELSFEEAAELAYFGAKILHPSSVLPARLKGIPVKLLNTMAPEARGTTISHKTADGLVKAVAAKDKITVIRIRSGRMLLAFGFLRSVFEVFERYKTSIDLISTSEVAISITIDDAKHLNQITEDLRKFGTVDVESDHCIICLVGQNISENKGFIRKLFEAVDPIPLRMICYGGSSHNVSLVIKDEYKKQALQVVNQKVFDLA